MAQEEKRVFDFALFPKSKTWKSLKVLFYFSSCSKVSYFFSQVVQRLSMAILTTFINFWCDFRVLVNFMNSLRTLFFQNTSRRLLLFVTYLLTVLFWNQVLYNGSKLLFLEKLTKTHNFVIFYLGNTSLMWE